MVVTDFITEIWAEEIQEALDAVERMMGAFPEPPHRQRFQYWHTHFCDPCKVYRDGIAEAIAKDLGKPIYVPRFSALVSKEDGIYGQ